MSAQLEDYVRHAERYGTEAIFETATEDLDVVALGRLACRLRHIERRWRCPKRDWLVLGLLDAGVRDRQVCDWVGISRPTLRKVRDLAKQAPDSAFPSGENGKKSLPLTPRLDSPASFNGAGRDAVAA
jgi:hypothetical protein